MRRNVTNDCTTLHRTLHYHSIKACKNVPNSSPRILLCDWLVIHLVHLLLLVSLFRFNVAIPIYLHRLLLLPFRVIGILVGKVHRECCRMIYRLSATQQYRYPVLMRASLSCLLSRVGGYVSEAKTETACETGS
jgi:hypothetical protein